MTDKIQAQAKSNISYVSVDNKYFDQRGLRRYAGVASLWALGVGAVISGNFSGWNYGLGVGGFVGLICATIIVAVMYLGLTFSLAEMSSAMPHTGGAYSFARLAMGPWGGFITGLTENVEYVLAPATVVFFISSYMSSIFQTPNLAMPFWWAGFYILFVSLNVAGAGVSFKATVWITSLALTILGIYWISAIPYFEIALALNIPSSTDTTFWFPFGVEGILKAMPFAVWFFLAIEQLPLAAEESRDPKRDMPKAILLGIFTLILTAFLTLFLVAGVGGGAIVMAASNEPILDGFRAFYGERLTKVLALAAVIGLIASFHTIIFAFGRQIYSLSRSGYFPCGLSITHRTRKTPYLALIAGATVGFAVMMAIWLTMDENQATTIIGTTLLNMVVFGAMLSYLLQVVSFIILRIRLPHIERPYRSALGIPGAVMTAIIAIITLVFQMQEAAYRQAVLPVATWLLLGIVYFLIWGRKNLVLSPEEAFALKTHR